ncbi:MAG: hypothetical protein UZ21_OP11001000948 [Microgenomates bacterium OLB22]|nr:MAG: hypothetical protein UZ21_OP11001000948 [Microgenomates bacterium OLB22]
MIDASGTDIIQSPTTPAEGPAKPLKRQDVAPVAEALLTPDVGKLSVRENLGALITLAGSVNKPCRVEVLRMANNLSRITAAEREGRLTDRAAELRDLLLSRLSVVDSRFAGLGETSPGISEDELRIIGTVSDALAATVDYLSRIPRELVGGTNFTGIEHAVRASTMSRRWVELVKSMKMEFPAYRDEDYLYLMRSLFLGNKRLLDAFASRDALTDLMGIDAEVQALLWAMTEFPSVNLSTAEADVYGGWDLQALDHDGMRVAISVKSDISLTPGDIRVVHVKNQDEVAAYQRELNAAYAQRPLEIGRRMRDVTKLQTACARVGEKWPQDAIVVRACPGLAFRQIND